MAGHEGQKMSIRLIQSMSGLGLDCPYKLLPALFSRLDFRGFKQLNFYRFPSKLHLDSISINFKTTLTDTPINSSLSRHSCYQYCTFGCTKNYFLPQVVRFLGCLFAFPCFTGFQWSTSL